MSTSKQIGWSTGIRTVCYQTAAAAVLWMASTSPAAAQAPDPANLSAPAAAPAPAPAPVPLPPAPDPAGTPPLGTPALPVSSKPIEPRDTEPVLHVIAPRTNVSILQLQSKVLEFSKRIEVVDGFDPEVLNVTPVSPNQIRLRAESTGVTSMTVKDEAGNIFNVEVFVEGDVRELKAYLERLFPGSAIDVVSLKESVILRGWVTEPQSIPQILAVAKEMYPTVHNQLQVGGVIGVQLHVKILEVQRSKLKQLGFNFVARGSKYALASTIGGLVPVTGITAPFGGPPVPSVGSSTAPLQFAITGNSNTFQGFLDALTTESLAKVLAEPTLVTTSGRPASLLSGGEFPILVPGAVGTVSIQFREFGVRMEAIPTVLGNGRLRLDIAPEVSERDFSSSVNISGIVVPGINTRRVNTQVEMNFGETIMIGGLISQKRITTSSKYPIIGELPVIGAAFSKKSHEVGETELLIMVTPEMAGPMRPDQVPHNAPGWMQDEPTSKELFLDGMLEVPSYGSECANGENGACRTDMAYGNGQVGIDSNSTPVCSPEDHVSPENALQLAPSEEEIITPSAPGGGEIQTMSGRSGKQQIIQAGGDPFRVPSRREIPESNTRSTTTESGSGDTNSKPGLISPPRSNSNRSTGRTRSNTSNPQSVRDQAN
jgi:pilus assembly protein CpaC